MIKSLFSRAHRKPLRRSATRGRRAEMQNHGLDYEQCEARNMLSASPGVEVAQELAGDSQFVFQHLESRPGSSLLQKGNSGLQVVDVVEEGGFRTTVLQQTLKGRPVHGSFVTVRQDSEGAVTSIDNRTRIHLNLLDAAAPAISFDMAEQIAIDGDAKRVANESTGQLVWFPHNGVGELAWEIDTTAALSPLPGQDELTFQTVVSASSGAVLSQSQSPTIVDSLVKDAELGVFPRIVINNAIGAAGSRAYAAPFDSVVALTLGCTGTLMAENVVISARHCGAGPGSTIRFGDNSNAPVFTATVQSSFLPAGGGSLLDGGDVAILTLTGNVPSSVATPMRFIDETSGLVGMTAATLGYGYNGLGSVGHGFSADGWRWGGENVIDVYGSPASASGSNIISTDFDNGTSGANTIPSSSATPLTFEATTAPGDSGGPVLVQVGSEWVISGVLSGGTTNTSVYGDISWWTGTAIYRSDIESFGGVFAGGGLGNVQFDQASYFDGDTATISVNDDNAITPISVTVTTDSGDSETLVLSGSTPSFSGSLTLAAASVTTGDGVLQFTSGDTLTVTYNDPDDGTGSPITVTDTATGLVLPDSTLIGVDFGEPGSPNPMNWTAVAGGPNTSLLNLIDENGNLTPIDLAIAESPDGDWDDFAVTPAASTIPQHLNSLVNIESQIYTGGDPISLTYSDLNPLADYEVYVMSAEGFFSNIDQRVTISGDGAPVVFDQNFTTDQLFVNDQLGDSSMLLSDYAQVITASASGQIVINITPNGGTQDVVLAGVAIFEVQTPLDLLDPFGFKFLDGQAAGGSPVDAEFSDDVYYQLAPSPTTNPIKQKIDLILQSEYGSGSVSSFEFFLEANMSGGPEGDVTQTIQLWNYNTSSWETVDVQAATNADSVVQVTPGGDLSRFVFGSFGEVTAKVTWVSDSFSGTPYFWSVDVDQFGWLIS